MIWRQCGKEIVVLVSSSPTGHWSGGAGRAVGSKPSFRKEPPRERREGTATATPTPTLAVAAASASPTRPGVATRLTLNRRAGPRKPETAAAASAEAAARAMSSPSTASARAPDPRRVAEACSLFLSSETRMRAASPSSRTLAALAGFRSSCLPAPTRLSSRPNLAGGGTPREGAGRRPRGDSARLLVGLLGVYPVLHSVVVPSIGRPTRTPATASARGQPLGGGNGPEGRLRFVLLGRGILLGPVGARSRRRRRRALLCGSLFRSMPPRGTGPRPPLLLWPPFA